MIHLVVDTPRKRRWDDLNKVLDADSHSKLKKGNRLNSSIAYSNIKWDTVQPIYGNILKSFTVPNKTLPEEASRRLMEYLQMVYKSVKFMSGAESKRMFYIAPIIIAVCYCFDGGIEILVEDTVDGKRIHANGHFEMVLKKGDKRVCIVEAKKDDMDQGRAQCLLGCEAVSDIENINTVYGIVTTYELWELAVSKDDEILREHLSLSIVEGKAADKEIINICEKIYSLLSDEF